MVRATSSFDARKNRKDMVEKEVGIAIVEGGGHVLGSRGWGKEQAEKGRERISLQQGGLGKTGGPLSFLTKKIWRPEKKAPNF